MRTERTLADFIVGARFEDIPAHALDITRKVLLAVSGTGIAGAGEDGIDTLRAMLQARAGAPQATTLVYGDRLPAPAAARLNATMCRALDFCDAMAPGPHAGSAVIPAALAAAELAGGCSGREFITAVTIGLEVGSRFNLSERMYDGFDPTGIAIPFGAAAASARVLGLTGHQAMHALALAFNRCGGSFQSNIDGSLAVRLIQGFVAETGVDAALMAQAGLTGPHNFLEGYYGFPHLYARDLRDAASFVQDLGSQWLLERMMFKKFPSCGVTQGVTQLALDAAAALQAGPDQVRSVRVRMPPYAWKLVGQPFKIGENPRVDAQFSVQYCVANAITRGSSRLAHFRVESIADPALRPLIDRVQVDPDPGMDARGHSSVDLVLETTDGRSAALGVDIAPGYPGNGLSDAEHRGRFDDCITYAQHPPDAAQVAAWLSAIECMEAVDDVRSLLPLLVTLGPGSRQIASR